MGPMLGLALLAVALHGCGRASDIPDIPDVVETMLAVEFPADGQIHMQSRGKFEIGPETTFCTFPDSFGIDSDAMINLFRVLKQPTTRPSGSGRWGLAVDKYSDCKLADSVLVAGSQLQNRQGKPYKVALAVWQGNPARGGAAWVGGVERLGSSRPDILIRSPFDVPGRDPPASEVKRFERYALSRYVDEDARLLSERVTTMIAEEKR